MLIREPFDLFSHSEALFSVDFKLPNSDFFRCTVVVGSAGACCSKLTTAIGSRTIAKTDIFSVDL